MKVFRFPAYPSCEKENRIPVRPEEKYAIIRDLNQRKRMGSKFSQNKRSSSLDSKAFIEKKKAQIELAYKGQSQKKQRSRSYSMSKNCFFSTIPSKPFQPNPIKMFKKEYLYPEKKLHIKQEPRCKPYYSQYGTYLELFMEKLKDALKIKAQKLFVEEFKAAVNWLHSLQSSNDDPSSFLKGVVDTLLECEERKNQQKIGLFYQSISSLQKEKTMLSMTNKRQKIKAEALQTKLSASEAKNLQLLKQINLIKIQKKITVSKVTQTDQPYHSSQKKSTKKGEDAPTIVSLIKQVRELKQREKQMSILLSQLRAENIQLEEVYSRGLTKIQNDSSEKQQSQEDSFETFTPVKVYRKFFDQLRVRVESSKQLRQSKKHDFGSYKQSSQITRNQFSCDADNSILEEVDALSFNYIGKEDQLEQYTPRNVYECKKNLGENLKKELELNLNALYEDDESQSSKSSAFPTV